MPAPAVSVVVPVYNSQQTVGAALASILGQTFEDFEAIVIDDGSTDATAAIVETAGDRRVRLLSVSHMGVARARNLGIAEARGALIAFLDADDLWRTTKLERQVELLSSRPDVAICVTAATRIDADSWPLAPIPIMRTKDSTEALLLHSMCVGCVSSGIVRRGTLEEVGGFDPGLSQTADWDLWLRLSMVTRFGAIDDDLVLYRTHAGNMSSNVKLLERDTFAVLNKFFAAPGAQRYASLRAHAYSNHWMTCSGSYLHSGQLGSSLRCLTRGIRLYPANITRPVGVPQRWVARMRRLYRGPA